MDTAIKTGIDAAKTASKWAIQKTAEATADLIGNEIADKITSLMYRLFLAFEKLIIHSLTMQKI